MGLGKRIREHRLARGWTLEKLEELSGVAAGTIHALEQRDSSRSQYFQALARALGLSVEELGQEPMAGGSVVAAESKLENVAMAADDLVIRQYDVRGSMGRGLILEAEPPGTIKSWRVDPEWLRLNVPHHTGAQNLCIVTGFGPSMRGMFNPGDPLLCDLGRKTVDVDGVYFFRVEHHGFIKILQRIPTDNGVVLRAKSKNPDYESFDITAKVIESGSFEVIGKILTVWKSEQQ